MENEFFVIEDELHGFYPGNEGNAVQFFYDTQHEIITVGTKYADDEEDDGWNWGLGATRINVLDVDNLIAFLTSVKARMVSSNGN